MKVAVIGGGAAGFFAAISCASHHPSAEVTLYEKSNKLLAKVRVSGGGRCNVTHACFQNSTFSKFYPRGEKFLKKAFSQFSSKDTVEWYESRGVKLKAEEDGRMFPTTDRSESIINSLLDEANRLNIKIVQGVDIRGIEPKGEQYELNAKDDNYLADKVIITTGGSPKPEGFNWLRQMGHQIEPPVPSLFTFNMPNESVKELMGLSVPSAKVKVQGDKLEAVGPLLITHWGMSGPAVLRLSAWGARLLNEKKYSFNIQVSWVGDQKEDKLRTEIQNQLSELGGRNVGNRNPFGLPQRLWEFLLDKIDQPVHEKWRDLGKKKLNRVINVLLNDTYEVKGKTTFKEEFVTCGGVSLSDINVQTMESKVCPNIYFAGEVMDLDGITGGFNFQAAWTTGFIAGKLGQV